MTTPQPSSAGDRKILLPTLLFLLVIILVPWPVGILLALRVPIGWPYGVVYSAWVAFAGLLGWLILARRPARRSTWPHKSVMKVALAACLVWLFFTNIFPHAVSVLLAGFVSTTLVVVFVLEFVIIIRRTRAGGAEIR